MMTNFYPGDVVRYQPNRIEVSALTPGGTYSVEQVNLKMGGPEVCRALVMILGQYHDGKDFVVVKKNQR